MLSTICDLVSTDIIWHIDHLAAQNLKQYLQYTVIRRFLKPFLNLSKYLIRSSHSFKGNSTELLNSIRSTYSSETIEPNRKLLVLFLTIIGDSWWKSTPCVLLSKNKINNTKIKEQTEFYMVQIGLCVLDVSNRKLMSNHSLK